MNWARIDSGNGLPPVWREAITLTWFMVNWTLRNKLQYKLNKRKNIFIDENAVENVVYEIAAILYRGKEFG